MARPRSTEVEGQMRLIETKHPMYDKFKELRATHNGLFAKKKKLMDAIKATREAIITLIKENNIKPDADGVIKFVMDDQVVKIQPGESKLSFTEVPKDDPEDDTKDDDDSEESK